MCVKHELGFLQGQCAGRLAGIQRMGFAVFVSCIKPKFLFDSGLLECSKILENTPYYGEQCGPNWCNL